MYRCFLILLTFLFSLNVLAQQSSFIDKVTQLDSITDINHRKVILDESAEMLLDEWKAENTIDETILKTGKITLIQSDDKAIEVAMLGAITYGGVFQLNWIIKESVSDNNAYWLFKDELDGHFVQAVNQLNVSFNKRDDDIYSLNIAESNGKKEYLKVVDVLTKCYFQKLQEQETDLEKDSINAILSLRLYKLWNNEARFDETFAQLKNLKTIYSDDRNIKICTYNIQKNNFKHEFHGAVISKIDDQFKVYPLNDVSDEIRSPDRASLTNKKWYGAMYLDIVQTSDRNRNFYTLIGYKGNDEFLKTRVLDVLTIQNGRIRFGWPLFKTDRITRHRIIYQYASGAAMMMRYDQRSKMIVFDNLEPAQPFYKGVYRYYGPDFTYNGFKFQKGYWILEEDIDLRNPKIN
ncbi:hypothetical protein [Carboxylicivirga sp. N1Y90]|uniref:hypothetical protein n=1 Tax=Carboxylicivirga fragile TaxID=3417571 RepID=UPI003D32AE43|nr:hypothetical protein [Marinilabiliaceae bacterium N1Y90]